MNDTFHDVKQLTMTLLRFKTMQFFVDYQNRYIPQYYADNGKFTFNVCLQNSIEFYQIINRVFVLLVTCQ